MRLTCSSLSLFSATPAEAIAIVAELGFPAMDLVGIPTLPPSHVDYAGRDPATLDALVDAIARSGIEVATVVAIPTDGLEHWDAEEIDARVAWAVQACRGSAAADSCSMPATRPPTGIERGATGALEGHVRYRLRAESAAGVTLIVEAPHTGTLAERFDQVAELMGAIDNPAIGIDFDTSHVARSGTSLEDSLASSATGSRRSPSATSTKRRVLPSRHRAGRFRRCFELLRRGYAGDLVIELETPGIEDVAGQRREIELTKAYVEELLAAP